MEILTDPDRRAQMTAAEKKRKLYEDQKQLLDTFLEKHAISRAQYEKSLGDLTRKMGYGNADQAPAEPSETKEK